MNNDNQLNSLINRLIASTDSEETKMLYAEWADSYDGDLDNFGYVAPQLGSAIFAELLPRKDALIYDAGCGTGLVGFHLSQLGYHKIDGADFSPDMLGKAKQLAVYKQLMTADFCAPISTETNVYDGLISIGVYSSRFSEYFLPEMIRILKPSAPMVFSCRPHYFEGDVQIQLENLVASQKITELTVLEKSYMLAQNANAFYISFKKADQKI